MDHSRINIEHFNVTRVKLCKLSINILIITYIYISLKKNLLQYNYVFYDKWNIISYKIVLHDKLKGSFFFFLIIPRDIKTLQWNVVYLCLGGQLNSALLYKGAISKFLNKSTLNQYTDLPNCFINSNPLDTSNYCNIALNIVFLFIQETRIVHLKRNIQLSFMTSRSWLWSSFFVDSRRRWSTRYKSLPLWNSYRLFDRIFHR